VKTRSIFLTILFSLGLFYVACGQSPEKTPGKAAASAERKSADQKKTVRIKHLAGEILAVDSKTKTIIMRSRDREVELIFDDSTVVKVDLDAVPPNEIPPGIRATVKYVERKGQYVAKGIFISTETAEKKESAPQSSFRNSA
jgi:ABC-type Fe3+-hydroxamate transport system substrate-binding protein